MSTMPNPQPALPAESFLSDLEKYFIDQQPINLWPVNQNSNFGLIRKLILDEMQEALTLLDELSNESFVSTASGYLGRWEVELGLPVGQGGRTDAQRRRTLESRLAIGPFTHARRNALIEAAIGDTFGEVPQFTAGGIPFGAGGIAFHSGIGDFTGTYAIKEDIENFSYEVRIRNDITLDEDWLRRELTWMTPGGISYTIVYVPIP